MLQQEGNRTQEAKITAWSMIGEMYIWTIVLAHGKQHLGASKDCSKGCSK